MRSYGGFCEPCEKFGMYTADNEETPGCLSRGSDTILYMFLEDN